MARCNICGKGPMVGNNVSHAKNRTKRRMNPNLHTKRLVIDGKPQRVLICTRCLRTEQKKAV